MTVLELIQKSADYLEKKHVCSPRLQAELLLAHVLLLPRMQLYLNFNRVVSDAEVDALRKLVMRRGQREPCQQILGSASFCGLEIAVNRNVLVPRPETELLAEHGWKFLSALASSPSVALDFGTGSGCIALALAANCPSALVHALDISEAALSAARENAARNKLSDRVQFHLSDGFAALPEGRRFDLIISNPPYIAASEIASLEPEVRDFEPRLALDGGTDGFDFFRRLAREAGAFLKRGGKLMLEFGDAQAAALREILEKQNWIVEAVLEDYTRRPRVMIAQWKVC